MPFTEEQAVALSAILDTLIPARDEADLPGAGGLGLWQEIQTALDRTPGLGVVLAPALDAAEGFAEVPVSEREARLNALAAELPAFVPTLLMLTYSAYYRHPRVLEALGHEPRPPHPDGYEIEESDLGLLDPVRDRPPLWREC